MRVGIALSVVAIALMVGGGLTMTGAQALEVLSGERGRVGSPVRFDDEGGTYSVLLLSLPLVDDETLDGYVVDLVCDVDDPDGTHRTIDHTDVGSGRSRTDVGVAVAQFDARPGTTTVACDWRSGRDHGQFGYTVARSRRTLDLVGLGALLTGLAVGLSASVLLVIGIRGRQAIVAVA